jgi:hypothetical protein
VIKEGLRLSHGVAGRLYRISPDKPLVYNDGKKEWIIPPGVSTLEPSRSLTLNRHSF